MHRSKGHENLVSLLCVLHVHAWCDTNVMLLGLQEGIFGKELCDD